MSRGRSDPRMASSNPTPRAGSRPSQPRITLNDVVIENPADTDRWSASLENEMDQISTRHIPPPLKPQPSGNKRRSIFGPDNGGRRQSMFGQDYGNRRQSIFGQDYGSKRQSIFAQDFGNKRQSVFQPGSRRSRRISTFNPRELPPFLDENACLGIKVQSTLHDVRSMLDLLLDLPKPVIVSTDSERESLSHSVLRSFVEFVDFSSFGWSPNTRVGIVLPDGPELGVCLVTVMAYCTSVPINYHMTDDEICTELSRLGAKSVIMPETRVNTGFVNSLEWHGINVVVLTPNSKTCGLFDLQAYGSDGASQGGSLATSNANKRKSALRASSRVSMSWHRRQALNQMGDYGMVLATSGTSGNKKTVPYTLETLIIGALCVAQSWALVESDVNLNMMPLYHVGGILRNLLAPVFSGGSVILTKGFDPSVFWDIIQHPENDCKPTWYYAVPTMHHAILQEGRSRGIDYPVGIRMIANAGGGLLPSLAVELREFFVGATVLPSYGMTECMPIATPPQGYALERPGTSGVSVGPEIAIMDDSHNKLPPKAIGHIMVRGPPVFQGYENDANANASSFTADGFFNTGDMGYLDEDGYLYVTGRSKEVINRGGEIISPVEVEDAVIKHEKVLETIAFSVPHDVLQETIGVVIVSTDPECRVDLPQLQNFVSKTLHPSKWPQLIVYMNELPKNQNNKPLRINLANRFGIAEINDKMGPKQRLYDAPVCPPRTAGIKTPIEAHPVVCSSDRAVETLLKVDGVIEVACIANSRDDLVMFVCQDTSKSPLSSEEIKEHLFGCIHDYDVPKQIIHLPKLKKMADGKTVDVDALHAELDKQGVDMEMATPEERSVYNIFLTVLELEKINTLDADFFELGGGSLKAGRVVGLIRKEYDISLPAMTLFEHRTIRALAALISERATTAMSVDSTDPLIRTKTTKKQTANEADELRVKSESSTCFVALFVQILPIAFFRPLYTAALWLTFLHILILTDTVRRDALHIETAPLVRVIQLLIAITISHTVLWIVMPTLGILFKWIVIGRYKAGSYPLWGSYYLRWWIVDQVLRICGRGCFGTSSMTLVLYARLMGAKVGKDVALDTSTNIGEFDLIDIGDGASFDTARIRPFFMETGRMVLKKITIGEHSVLNIKSVVAAGHTVPPFTVFPPLSSSYEMQDASPHFQTLCRTRHRDLNVIYKIIFGWPLLFIINLLSMFPWMCIIYLLAYENFFTAEVNLDLFGQMIDYFSHPARIGFHYWALVIRDTLCPFLHLGICIAVKWILVGRFKNGGVSNSQFNLFRHWLMKKLFQDGSLCGVYALIGRHYEATSTIYRALGAKIGKRIYWPGTPLFFYEFDLLEVQDDVVFGSRTHVLCSDSVRSTEIKIEAGSMIADRCVLLPGTMVGRGCVMGSGALSQRDTEYPPASVWIGSRGGKPILWDAGDPKRKHITDTTTPFGKAFYNRDAEFRVIPMWACILYNIAFEAIRTVYWTTPLIIAMISADRFFLMRNLADTTTQVIAHVIIVFVCAGAFSIFAFLAMAFEVSVKWTLFGRRKPGRYDWDKSSYCQRWQILIAAHSLRGDLLEYIRGSWYIVHYFRSLGCRIGKRVCLYPTGGDPMMTEPDLVKIGDDVAIDVASVVCHINSRGQFSLNPLVIGNGSVLRAESRLLSGAEMEPDSTLLEHTLVVSGELVEGGSTWQGWPGTVVELESISAYPPSNASQTGSAQSDITLVSENNSGSAASRTQTLWRRPRPVQRDNVRKTNFAWGEFSVVHRTLGRLSSANTLRRRKTAEGEKKGRATSPLVPRTTTKKKTDPRLAIDISQPMPVPVQYYQPPVKRVDPNIPL
ncbi:uncharacterized protein BJ171DRAFT_596561 [Polychytrium aggregatum]|uniref:uncharacterized protein n=1 Tax=Polychytrium aggregatum TaxID=110093 RepID=UPI0022FE61A0|nr:uncharacterized protein BJ171DRAFT_596561 [Polychytrium aggregatum]KAI9207543.1 hypothetical protein BJ171DRAFT_596561 [Polychytrium aggregatum]